MEKIKAEQSIVLLEWALRYASSGMPAFQYIHQLVIVVLAEISKRYL